MDLHLEPEIAVDVLDAHGVARSNDAWLRVVPAEALTHRRWIRLRYSASYFDDPIRPLIRFATSDGEGFLQPMNGPVLGSGEWIGRVPDRAVAVSIAPAVGPGRFDFKLDCVQSVSRLSLVRRGLSYDRGSLFLGLGAKIINARQERWDMLKFAGSATPLQDYDAWHRRLYRPFDLNGLDRPRADWAATPAIRLMMSLQSSGVAALRTTLASLRAQAYTRWSLHAVVADATPPDVLAAYRAAAVADGRLIEIGPAAQWPEVAVGFGGDDVVAVISPGDVIPNYALAVVAERLASAPNLSVVYGDEDAVADDDVLHSPLFKPDWSPILFKRSPYLGRLTCVRCAKLAGLAPGSVGRFMDDENAFLTAVLTGVSPQDVGHIRRILYRRRRERNVEAGSTAAIAAAAAVSGPADEPEVAIVIPTRDRATLLSQCMKSLRGITDYPRYRVVIVDNGSTEPGAVALLRELAALPNVAVISSPGPFNFSELCNTGARASQASVLVFLNNDTVIFDSRWLAALVKYAVRPNVGVVGAKLLFPDNRIEHAGVVLGHGGIAGHLYHREAAGAAGYMGQLLVAREVSAVTGACIAVERSKFEAVGGFDAENLPVDLNDIDLCLKISKKGWTTVWTPESTLYHLQSASRGFQHKPTVVYRKEREFFLRQWPDAIRDDPSFHPALSLYSHEPALA